MVFREQSLRLNEIEHQIAYKEIASSVPTIQGKLLNADGTLAGGSSAWGTSDFIAVHSGDTFKLTASQYAPSPYVALQVYNSSKDVVTNYIAGADIFADEAFNLNVMEDGYIRICYRISSGYTISLLKLLSIDNRLSLLESSGQTKIINKNINFVGMSIWWYDGRTLAEGHMGGEVARGYQTLLKEQFDFLSDTGTLYCYSGNSLGAVSISDADCIMNHSSSWTASTNAIWTLDSITNDFKRNIPIGTYSDYENKTGNLTYYGALREFKDKVVDLSGSDAIIVCSNALRRNNSGYTSTSQNTQGHTLKDYEHALLDIASREHWYFVDQFRLCGVTDDNIDLTTIDGLHLNNFGYTLAVKPWIEQFAIIHRALQ